VSRITNLQAVLATDESFLVTNLINVRYLSGFTGSNAALVVSPESAILITDSRYEIQSRAETHDVDIVMGRDVIAKAMELLSGMQFGCEGDHVTVNQEARLKAAGNPRATKKVVETFRQVKDKGEIDLIRTACQIATCALGQLVDGKVVGLTEREIARNLRSLMLDAGADDIAFETIVASGPHSAIPHHQPTSREVAKGDLLKIDFGAQVSGYLSDCTRTFVVGPPSDWHNEMYAAVHSAQAAGRNAVSSVSTCADIVSAVRTNLQTTGYLEYFTHGLGHGVGLEIHEDPFLSSEQTDRLAVGTVVTVEPGVYFEHRGGVRIEDTVAVTETGYENLTNFSHDLIDIS